MTEKTYSTKDLKGLKIGHDLKDIVENVNSQNEELVLILKDSNVLDCEEDNLVSVALEGRKDHLSSEKTQEQYKDQDNDSDLDIDIDNFENDKDNRIVLKKYDKIDNKSFILDNPELIKIDSIKNDNLNTLQTETETETSKKKFMRISLDDNSDEDDEYSIFLNKQNNLKEKSKESSSKDKKTIKVKKIKKKSSRRRKLDNDESIVLESNKKLKFTENSNIEDDENELQKFIAEQRVKKLSNKAKSIINNKNNSLYKSAQEIIQSAAEIENAQRVKSEPENGLIIDDLDEFLSNLKSETEPKLESQSESIKIKTETTKTHKDIPMKKEETMTEMEIKNDFNNSNNDNNEIKKEPSTLTNIIPTPIIEEPDTSIGLAGTLQRYIQSGDIKTESEVDAEIKRKQREQRKWKLEMIKSRAKAEKLAQLRKEELRKSGKYERMSAREKEEIAQAENKQKQLIESIQDVERYKNYKPDVRLVYVDDEGHELTPKGAFRHMSHQFHNKNPGKLKTEKYMHKKQEEKRRMAASTTNGPVVIETVKNKGEKQKEDKDLDGVVNKRAGIRLQ